MKRSIVLAGILVVGLAGCGGQTHSADAVMVVPPGVPSDDAATASTSAAATARTYAEALSSSDDLVASVAQSTGADPAHIAEHLVATVEEGTSVVTLSYADADDQAVRDVLGAATAILTGPQPPAPVTVGTLLLIAEAQPVGER